MGQQINCRDKPIDFFFFSNTSYLGFDLRTQGGSFD